LARIPQQLLGDIDLDELCSQLLPATANNQTTIFGSELGRALELELLSAVVGAQQRRAWNFTADQ
jgi:hypothetical protein